MITQACRSESFKIKMENMDSVRLNATALSTAEEDGLREEERRFGKKGRFLVHQR